MSDLHLRILHLVAHRSQRELDNHDAVHHLAAAASTARREDLARKATRTRARAAAAQARRRYHGQTAGPDRGPLADLLTDRKPSRTDRNGQEPRDEHDQPSVKDECDPATTRSNRRGFDRTPAAKESSR